MYPLQSVPGRLVIFVSVPVVSSWCSLNFDPVPYIFDQSFASSFGFVCPVLFTLLGTDPEPD